MVQVFGSSPLVSVQDIRTMHRFRSRGSFALGIWLVLGLAARGLQGSPEPGLKTVLQRAGTYSADYHERFTALVAEERYVQRVGPDPARAAGGRAIEQERILTSDYVIVRDFAGSNSWLGVRDVFDVDGEPVNADRTRLQSLLGDTTRDRKSTRL